MMTTDIILDPADRGLFRRELAGTYVTSAAADPVLSAIGYRRERRPNIDAMRPDLAWNEIFIDFDNGVVTAPYRKLLAVVLTDRPGNGVFAALAERYGAAAPSLPHSRPAQPAAGGGHRRPAERTRVFLCYSVTDRDAVVQLYRRLRADGYSPWLDTEDIVGGQNRDLEIRRAIRSSRFVVACLSGASVSAAGRLHRDLRLALETADEQPEGSIYLIPARLDRAELPDRLRGLETVDLFAPGGYDRLRRALESAPS